MSQGLTSPRDVRNRQCEALADICLSWAPFSVGAYREVPNSTQGYAVLPGSGNQEEFPGSSCLYLVV